MNPAKMRNTITTQAVARRRRPRGAPEDVDSSGQTKKLPEYLETHEVEAIIRVAGNARPSRSCSSSGGPVCDLSRERTNVGRVEHAGGNSRPCT